LAHLIETLLGRMRDGRLELAAGLIDALLSGTDRIYSLLDDIEHSNEADVTAVSERLKSLLGKETPADTGKTPPAEEQQPKQYHFKIDLAEYFRRHRKSPVVLVKELQTHGTIAEPTLHVPAGDLRQGLPDGPLVYAARYTSPLGPQELRQ